MKLKKYILLTTIASIFFACSDKLEEAFYDPDKHSPKPEDLLPGMMTQMLKTRFFVQDYGEWYWNINGGFGIPGYIQLAVRRPHPSESSYYVDWQDMSGAGNFYSDMEITKRFGYLYTNLKNWGLIRDEMAPLSDAEYKNLEIYYLVATTIKDVVALQTVDIFNKIPYEDAFKGTLGVFFTRYDEAEDIYKKALQELSDIADQMPQSYANMPETLKTTFNKQDIAFKGDIDKWVQYIHSIRLKHAVRVSGVNAELAKTHISTVIGKLPSADLIWENTQKNENVIGNSAGGIYSRAIYEHAYATLIPNIIMQAMNYGDLDYVEGVDDPRLPVIATPTRYSTQNWQFTGVSMDYDAQYPYWATGSIADSGPGLTARTFTNYPTSITTWLRSTYSQYNIGTFTFGELPSYMSSRAENDLFLAEVALKGLATTGKPAADHVRDAVIHSTEFWYEVNGLSNFFVDQAGSVDSLRRVFKPTIPNNATIGLFADKIKGEFELAASEDDKMEVIMTQKYIHLNILQILELWAEMRRTRLPRMEQLKVNGVTFDPVVERAKYPSSEAQRNTDNYNKVYQDDNFTSPIFWVPADKRNVKPYRNDYLPLKGYLPLPNPNPNR